MDSHGLQPLDWALIGIYAASTIALGFYLSRKQSSTKEYFIGSGSCDGFHRRGGNQSRVDMIARCLIRVSVQGNHAKTKRSGPGRRFLLNFFHFGDYAIHRPAQGEWAACGE